MDILIKIPKEFEKHFDSDRFEDSLARVASDIESFGFQLAGRYEQETITMLREALRDGILLPKGHKRLIEDNFKVGPVFDKEGNRIGYQYVTREDLDNAQTIVEADKEN